MLTVKSVMTQLTDPELILQRMSDTLRKIDPKFVHEEQKYFCAVDALKEVIGDPFPVPMRIELDYLRCE